MKTLKDVAGIYKQSVSTAIQSGPTKAYKTGHLYNKFNSDGRNSADSIGFAEGTKFIFRVVVGPDGAEYGSYVNSGTRYMHARPFGEAGANSPQFKTTLNEFMNGKVDDMLGKVVGKIYNDFKKYGFEVL